MNQYQRRVTPKGDQQKPRPNYPVSPRSGFTILELMIVVSLIGLLAVIAIPNFLQSRTAAQRGACIHNLRQIDEAIEQWAMLQQKTDAATVTWQDIQPYLNNSVACPASGSASFDKSYSITTVSDPPRCMVVPDTHILVEDAAARPTHKKKH